MQRLTFPFPFVHHQSHDWPEKENRPSIEIWLWPKTWAVNRLSLRLQTGLTVTWMSFWPVKISSSRPVMLSISLSLEIETFLSDFLFVILWKDECYPDQAWTVWCLLERLVSHNKKKEKYAWIWDENLTRPLTWQPPCARKEMEAAVTLGHKTLRTLMKRSSLW